MSVLMKHSLPFLLKPNCCMFEVLIVNRWGLFTIEYGTYNRLLVNCVYCFLIASFQAKFFTYITWRKDGSAFVRPSICFFHPFHCVGQKIGLGTGLVTCIILCDITRLVHNTSQMLGDACRVLSHQIECDVS